MADNIKNLRERHNLTQGDLAEIAGVTDGAISSWEKGNSVPRMGAIQRMADHFGILKSQIIEDPETQIQHESFSRIFTKLSNHFDLTSKELAEKIGVSVDTISAWKKGIASPQISQLSAIADIFKIHPIYLISGGAVEGVLPSGAIRPKATSVTVPLYGSIAAGVPLEMIPVEEYIEIPEEVGHWYPKAFLLKVNGDSMNKVVPNGAYALIDPYNGEDAGNGDVVAVQVNGYDATLKRFYRLQNTAVLEPDSYNPDHIAQNFTTSELNELRIIGKLVWYMSPPNIKY